MIDIQLPKVITDFIISSNEHNTAAMLACMDEDAVLSDHGREFKGATSIKKWSDDEFIGSHVQIEVIDFALQGMEYVVSTEINGDYPEWPYNFTFSFTLNTDQIAKLQISDS